MKKKNYKVTFKAVAKGGTLNRCLHTISPAGKDHQMHPLPGQINPSDMQKADSA